MELWLLTVGVYRRSPFSRYYARSVLLYWYTCTTLPPTNKTINCQLLLRSCHIVALFIAHRVIQSFTSEYYYSTRTRIACTVLLMVMYRWSLPVDMIANQHRRIIRVSITAYRHSGIPFNPISYKTPDRPRIKIIQMVVTH